MKQSPLHIYCRRCGAPAGFDILRQTYRCAHCGELTGIREAEDEVLAWRTLRRQDKNAVRAATADRTCPTCGAPIRFPAGEASAACEYCGTKLIRPSLEKQKPDLVIPFFITPDEARERMQKWGKSHRLKPEGKMVLANTAHLEGFYLPYRLVRGPVYGTVDRDGNQRTYRCAGFLEGTAVSASKDLDNLVLNGMEPFDWTAAEPFGYGWIAGQKVRLSDVSEAEIDARVRREVEADFLPEVEKVMQTSGVRLTAGTGNLTNLRALLPVYCIKTKEITAVMNGQTGRIAVSGGRQKKSWPWVIEPLIYTILATVLLGIPYHFAISVMMLFASVFGCIFFGLMGNERSALIRGVILRSREARTRREDGKLFVEEGKDILKNPYGTTPVFFEPNEEGKNVPVRIHFYSLLRWLSILGTVLLTVFLPVVVAAPLRLLIMRGTGEHFMDKFQIGYGGAWYVLTGFIVIIFFAGGVRRNLYDCPLLYEILPDGRTRRLSRFREHFIGLGVLFGLGTPKKPGTPKKKRTWKDIRFALDDFAGVGLILILVPLVILIGCVAAILT